MIIGFRGGILGSDFGSRNSLELLSGSGVGVVSEGLGVDGWGEGEEWLLLSSV